ncbi:hypothetical protein, partial [Undibacterium luofuense]
QTRIKQQVKKNRHHWRFFRILVGLFFFVCLPSSYRLRLGIAKVKKEKEVDAFHTKLMCVLTR